MTSVCARRTARSPPLSGADLQVDGEVRAGRHVDEGVDVAEADRHLRRVEVDHAPVRAVDRPALPSSPTTVPVRSAPAALSSRARRIAFAHG